MTWRPEVREVADAVLGDAVARGAVHAGFDAALWTTVAGLGWPGVGLAEADGGQGGDLVDLLELVRAVGRHGVGVPLVETAGALGSLPAGGVPTGGRAPLAVAVAAMTDLRARRSRSAVVLDGRLRAVTWAQDAAAVVAATELDGEPVVVVIPTDAAGVVRVGVGATTAGEPRDDLVLHEAPTQATVVGAAAVQGLRTRVALLRAAALLGAVERAVDLAVRHTAERTQFGGPLARLQAVQHLLGHLAAERDLLEHTVTAAAQAGDDVWRATAARVTAARVAGTVAAGAHQVHGALGMTHEYPLHHATTRLWAWRDADETQRAYEERLGTLVLAGVDDAADLGVAPGPERAEELLWQRFTTRGSTRTDRPAGLSA